MPYHICMIESDLMKMLSSCEMSPKTQENYRYYCLGFFEWFFARYPEGDPSQVEPHQVMEWMKQYPRWAQSTRYSAVAGLKKFFRWKWGENHPVVTMRIKKIDPGPQRTLDQSELMQVLAGIDTTSDVGIRNMAILSLMADTGMRSSEVCNLELRRLDIRKQSLVVQVKGGGFAEKRFFDYTTACINQWLVIRPSIASPFVKFVFVSVGGKHPGMKMTVSGMRYITDQLSLRTGVVHFSPHSMRRTFATLATENGAPSRVVQVAGGWKSIRMVERYTQALKVDAIRPYSPIDRLLKEDLSEK